MIYISDLEELLSNWEKTCSKEHNNPEYLIGIKECIADLRNLINDHYKKEAEEMVADNYLASMENFERNY
jgi:hypothetical protein